MFKYNDWSDLKDSDILVMPIRKEGDKILCLTEDEEEIYFDFDDFDFDKTPGERQNIDVTIIIFKHMVINLSFLKFDKEEDKLIIVNDITMDNKVVVSAAIVKIKSNSSKAKDYMVEDPFEKAAILKQAGFTYSKLRNVNIYVEEVM